jgi:AmmeMemoRadiSam system protein A
LEQLLADQGDTLLAVAKDAIKHGLAHSTKPSTKANSFPAPLRKIGASFVTLYQGDTLRGCVGTSNAHRPLVVDVAANAYAAAFSDSRFSRLEHREFSGLAFQVSLLTEPCPLAFEDEPSLLSQLRPHIDGVVLDCDGKQALFLPQVWEKLPDAKEFIDQLKLKAGCNTDFWSPSVKAWRFETRSTSSKKTA